MLSGDWSWRYPDRAVSTTGMLTAILESLRLIREREGGIAHVLITVSMIFEEVSSALLRYPPPPTIPKYVYHIKTVSPVPEEGVAL